MCSDLSPEETPVWLFQAVTKLDMLEKVPSGRPGQVDFHLGQVMGKGLRKSSSNQIIHKDKQEVAPSKQNVSLEFNFFSKPWLDHFEWLSGTYSSSLEVLLNLKNVFISDLKMGPFHTWTSLLYIMLLVYMSSL